MFLKMAKEKQPLYTKNKSVFQKGFAIAKREIKICHFQMNMPKIYATNCFAPKLKRYPNYNDCEISLPIKIIGIEIIILNIRISIFFI